MDDILCPGKLQQIIIAWPWIKQNCIFKDCLLFFLLSLLMFVLISTAKELRQKGCKALRKRGIIIYGTYVLVAICLLIFMVLKLSDFFWVYGLSGGRLTYSEGIRINSYWLYDHWADMPIGGYQFTFIYIFLLVATILKK